MTDTRVRRECIAGCTTFVTMAYIVVVNPSILATEGTGIPFAGAMTATVVLCFVCTLLMGLYAKLPFAVAPGMGINAFFTYTLILGENIPWTVALGLVFWAGVVFLFISVTPIREAIARAIPETLRIAAACGIGIFLTFIGLKNAGVVVPSPATFVKFGGLTKEALFCLLGLSVIVLLHLKKNPLALLIGIATVTGASWGLGYVSLPKHVVSAPEFHSVFFKADIVASLKITFLPAIISVLFTDLFDSISTFVGVSRATNLIDEHGEPKNLRQGLIVDSIATLSAGLFGTSAGTAFIESAAGIEMGGRTGLTAVVTALCFLPCLFLAPLAGMVPPYATAPVLIFVGALMFRSVVTLPTGKLEELLPAYLTIVLIPLTFSITQGILWGFISYSGMFVLSGRGREVRPVMYVLSALSLALITIQSLTT